MKIIVDADACPIKQVILKIGKAYNVKVLYIASLNHELHSDDAEVITVDAYKEAADMKIVNICETGDIIVTDDYGLASLVLSKGGLSLSTRGHVYTKDNIEILLERRHMALKLRKRNKIHMKGPKKRTRDDLEKFKEMFSLLIEKNK